MSVRFGLAYDFRNPERWGRPWAEVFDALLEQIEYVDTLGFDSIWITEHHFVPDGYAPSPVTLLAAIAARTENVKLGTDILLLPLYHAVRLAEDLATVDLISGGRLMLGIGMGYRDEEFEAFGQTRRERVGRTDGLFRCTHPERLEVLIAHGLQLGFDLLHGWFHACPKPFDACVDASQRWTHSPPLG